MMKHPDQHIGLRILRAICPSHMHEEIEGDLLQRYYRDVTRLGEKAGKRKLAWNALRYIRPGIILRNKFSLPTIRPDMISNYLKIALRSILKQKAYSLLNVAGLAIGMAATLLILQYVKYEESFDRFHSKADNIYRLQYNGYHQNVLNFQSAVAVPMAGPFYKKNFEEVEDFVRLYPRNGIVKYESATGPIEFREEKMQYADPSVFKVFDFKLKTGDASTALDGLNKLVISETAAKKYFGNEDAIGKRLTLNQMGRGAIPFEVTGVLFDVPDNSHIKFDFLLSYATLNAMTENWSETSWGWYDFYVFVLVKPGTDIASLQAKADALLAKELGERWSSTDGKQEFILRPLTDIHLHSKLQYEAEPAQQRDGNSIYALTIIAFFILAIAWVNYINLSTARSLNRANEVGVRKVMGAYRGQLIGQFLTESFLLNLLACATALLIVRLMWVPFSHLTGWNIPMSFLYEKNFWKGVGLVFVAGTLLSGFYPAIVLSSFKPVAVLKGRLFRSAGGNLLRTSLVVFQFAASVFLIVGATVVYRQLSFMKTQELGMEIQKTIVLKGPSSSDSTFIKKIDHLRNSALAIPGVSALTTASFIPGDEIFWTSNVRKLTSDQNENFVTTAGAFEADFIPMFRIKLIAGRNFDRERPNDPGNSVLVNEALSKQLRYQDPQEIIGEKLVFGEDTVDVVGVTENFHQMSLKEAVAPMLFVNSAHYHFVAVKFETKESGSVVEQLSQPWREIFPGTPIDYFYLDQFFNKQYEMDDRFADVFTIFTGLAIFIASLGLLGLASFMAIQRTREIGIRKVLGSDVSQIVLLLARGFLRPIIISNLIGWPVAWFVMNKWLETFPYRTSIPLWIFFLAGLAVVLLAFVSVSSQTLKAALTKPADTLKHE